jgi:hypothetical protein
VDDSNRRRHHRARDLAGVPVSLGGTAAQVTRVVDVSLGGALLEIDRPVALRDRVVVMVGAVARAGRVVRIRWCGRERGAQMPMACAVMFDEGDQAGVDALAAVLPHR